MAPRRQLVGPKGDDHLLGADPLAALLRHLDHRARDLGANRHAARGHDLTGGGGGDDLADLAAGDLQGVDLERWFFTGQSDSGGPAEREQHNGGDETSTPASFGRHKG